MRRGQLGKAPIERFTWFRTFMILPTCEAISVLSSFQLKVLRVVNAFVLNWKLLAVELVVIDHR